ncbi:TolC family protein [Chelativorans sp. AA-79]|uniref:TolC family protein n=1 Tax=Chelativorans sp. AA-79 TaxID=3028735 RepID=UPI0023F769E5|nr:TolC family protein [Chelativorans sp. AA-79]WEX08263.1 TolC family protein [Chelativorans sp. AA-79]
MAGTVFAAIALHGCLPSGDAVFETAAALPEPATGSTSAGAPAKHKVCDCVVPPGQDAVPAADRRVARAPGGLRDAALSALDYSSEIRGSRAAVAAADAQVDQARSGYFPALDSNAGIGTDGEHDYEVTLSQPLYDWGRTAAKVGGARAGRSAAQVELSAQREQVMLDAASAYIEVARAAELEKVAADELKAYRRIANLARQRTEGGYGDATEATLAEVHVGEASSSLADAQGKLRDARSVFASRVGRGAGTLPPVPELSTALKTALRLSDGAAGQNLSRRADQAPTVKAALARASEADASAAAEEAQLFPTLSAEAFVRGDDARDDLNKGIGLRVTSPTVQGLSNLRRVEAAKLAAEEATWKAETARRDVLRQVQAFLDQEPTLRSRQSVLKEQRVNARQLRDLYEDQFKTGTRSLSDLVTVQSDLTRIESSLINVRFDLYDLQYKAAASLGMLGGLLEITPAADAGGM